MHRVGVADYQHLSRITLPLKRPDNDMLTKVPHLHALNLKTQTARRILNQINRRATTVLITRGRLDLHERAHERLDIALPRAQAFENLMDNRRAAFSTRSTAARLPFSSPEGDSISTSARMNDSISLCLALKRSRISWTTGAETS